VPLTQARILEIGFGQRPFRLMALDRLGHDVVGVDLDEPIYNLRLGNIARVAKRNGPIRAFKSLARRLIFDNHEYRGLRSSFALAPSKSDKLDPSRLKTGDVSDPKTWAKLPGPFDFVYSSDVFEHIPPDHLRTALGLMAKAMSERSVAVLTPMVFTGIAGGHDLDWYPYRANEPLGERTPPWGHLTGESKAADTYVNKLSRKDFRAMLAEVFEIVEERGLDPDLGRRHLTPERRAALKDYDEDELFSNRVFFVVRKKAA
jgi:hypothetical protein